MDERGTKLSEKVASDLERVSTRVETTLVLRPVRGIIPYNFVIPNPQKIHLSSRIRFDRGGTEPGGQIRMQGIMKKYYIAKKKKEIILKTEKRNI